MAFLALITRWWCFAWVRAGFPLAVRISFTVGNAVRFLSNELIQIEYLRDVLILTSTDEYPATIWEILFRWYQDFNRISSCQIRCL